MQGLLIIFDFRCLSDLSLFVFGPSDKSRSKSSSTSSLKSDSSGSFLSFSSSSNRNSGHATPDNSIRFIFNTPSSASSSNPASPLTAKLAPVVYPRRRSNAEKPMLFELPFAQFDAYFPPHYTRVGFRPAMRKRGQTPLLSRSMLAKDSWFLVFEIVNTKAKMKVVTFVPDAYLKEVCIIWI